MKFKRFDKRFNSMLYIGLGFYLGTLLLRLLLYLGGVNIEGQEVALDYIKDVYLEMPLFAALLFCVLQPALEEASFRLWGVGKKWTTIVCLALMASFLIAAWYALPLEMAMVVVWLKVRDRYRQMWINAVLSSVIFALAHISGLADAGFWAVATTLLSIFGLAMILAWLTINLSFWFSVLLHAVNNTLGILPLMLVPVGNYDTTEYPNIMSDGTNITTTIESVNLFTAKDYKNFEMVYPGEKVREVEFCDEPGKIAANLLSWSSDSWDSTNNMHIIYRGASLGEALEERVHYKVAFDKEEVFPSYEVYKSFCTDFENYSGRVLKYDTIEADFNAVWLHYDDGRVVPMDSLSVTNQDRINARALVEKYYGKQEQITEWAMMEDSTMMNQEQFALLPDPSRDKLILIAKKLEKKYGFSIELRPVTSGVKCRIIEIK